MNLEDDLPELMREAVATIEPPAGQHLAAAGLRRGRALRRRSRLILGVEGLAATAVVVAGSIALASSVLGGGGPISAGSAPSTAHSSAAPTVVAPSSKRPITPQIAASIFAALLPRGHLTHLSGGQPLSTFVNGNYRYDDGHGMAQMIIGLGWGRTGNPKTDAFQDPCPLPSTTPGSTCTIGADHSQLRLSQGYEYPDRVDKGALEWSVEYLRPDGAYVSVYELNATDKAGPITRPEPPLTVAELTAIVTSDRWQVTVDPTVIASAAHLFAPDATPAGR